MTESLYIDLLNSAAVNWESEGEYAGRMETWCWYCKEYQGENADKDAHKDGCLHLRAEAELKNKENKQ